MPGDWLVKLDLKDAYLSVLIHASHQKFLTFQWKKQGMAIPGPPIWIEQCPLHSHQGHETSGSQNEAAGNQIDTLPRRHADHGPISMELLNSLGFIINLKKSVTVPTQKTQFLGSHWIPTQ